MVCRPRKNALDAGHQVSPTSRLPPGHGKLLKVPDGWELKVAAAGLGRPRMMYTGPQGQLYITRRDAGDVLMLTDQNGDNVFDRLQTILYPFKGVRGITIKDDWMYLCNNRELRRYPIKPDGMLGEENSMSLSTAIPFRRKRSPSRKPFLSPYRKSSDNRST